MTRITQLLQKVHGGELPGHADALFCGCLRRSAPAGTGPASRRTGGRTRCTTLGPAVPAVRQRRGVAGRGPAQLLCLCLAGERLGDPEWRAERRADTQVDFAADDAAAQELAESLSGDEETILKVHEALLALEQADARLAQVWRCATLGGTVCRRSPRRLN